MKVKSIIICGLLLLGVGAATTSCEDMFTAENKLVSTDLAPQDTVYQVMGIVKRMQKLADRTVLLGEVRADLVEVDATVASTDLQQLSNNIISTDNVYNQPADYYAVINNCNIYLAYVDSLLPLKGGYYFEKEICAVKSFRAWCYLELAKIYGEVPLVTKPVLTAGAAEKIVASGEKADMATILDFCINDLKDYPLQAKNKALLPQNYYDDPLFIPVRPLLAELYLWRATYTGNTDDYIQAVRVYHEFFNYPSEERGTGFYSVRWQNREHSNYMNFYSLNRFNYSSRNETDVVGVMVCDTVSYYGNTSDLRLVFNSQYSNNYYPWVTPSQRVRDITEAQNYCFYDYAIKMATYMSHDKNEYTSSYGVGDLRFYSVYLTESNLAASQYDASVNSTKSYINKWLDGNMRPTNGDQKNKYVPYYRVPILYLHFAEALNGAGFPETAFAVLKYGLTYEVMNDRSIISQDEFDRLCEIKSYGHIGQEPQYRSDAELSGKANNSVAIWLSTVFGNPNKTGLTSDPFLSGSTSNMLGGTGASIVQMGIHSFGSGDPEFDILYSLDDEDILSEFKPYVPVPEVSELPENPTEEEQQAWEEEVAARDAAIAQNEAIAAENASNPVIRQKRQARVAKFILEEEALEGMFEGTRFYDLMRYQMRETGGKLPATITLPAYIEELYGATSRMTGKPWYLALPTR